jgi:hypothetical protein
MLFWNPLWKIVSNIIRQRLGENAKEGIARVGGIWRTLVKKVDEISIESLSGLLRVSYLFHNTRDAWEDSREKAPKYGSKKTYDGYTIPYDVLKEGVLNGVVHAIIKKGVRIPEMTAVGLNADAQAEIVRAMAEWRFDGLLKSLKHQQIQGTDYVLLEIANAAYKIEKETEDGFPKVIKLGNCSTSPAKQVVKSWKHYRNYKPGSFCKQKLLQGSPQDLKSIYYPNG